MGAPRWTYGASSPPPSLMRRFDTPSSSSMGIYPSASSGPVAVRLPARSWRTIMWYVRAKIGAVVAFLIAVAFVVAGLNPDLACLTGAGIGLLLMVALR